MRYKKNDEIENYLPEWGLQISIMTFFDRMHILCFDFMNTIENQEFYFLTKICKIRIKRWNAKSFTSTKSTIIWNFEIWDHLFEIRKKFSNFENMYVLSAFFIGESWNDKRWLLKIYIHNKKQLFLSERKTFFISICGTWGGI